MSLSSELIAAAIRLLGLAARTTAEPTEGSVWSRRDAQPLLESVMLVDPLLASIHGYHE